jgi:hypothetical protein
MSVTTRGGGAHKKPVIDSAKEIFAYTPFTLAHAVALVSGFNRSICIDLVQTGEVMEVFVSGHSKEYSPYPKWYRFSNKEDLEMRQPEKKRDRRK